MFRVRTKTGLLLASAVLFGIAAALPLAGQAVTANRYTLPSNVGYGLGYISADAAGRIWAGPSYSANGSATQLYVVSPGTNQLTIWTHQQSSVFAPPVNTVGMTAVDDGGKVWFRGGNANGAQLVSRLDPTTGLVVGWPATPTDLDPDPQGKLWMSLTGGGVGLLDPITNVLTTWPIGAAPIASDGQGRAWFKSPGAACFAAQPDSITMLRPASNTATTWVLPTPSAPQFAGSIARVLGPRGITVDSFGKVWIAIWYQRCGVPGAGSAVAVLDPSNNQMMIWPCPAGCDSLATISLDAQGRAWLTDVSTSGSTIDRLDLNTNPVSFIEYNDDILTGCAAAPVSTVADSSGDGWTSYQAGGCTTGTLTELPP